MTLPVTDTWTSGSNQGIATYGAYAVLEGGFNLINGSPGLEVTSGTYNTARRTDETPNADQYSQTVITSGQISTGTYTGPAVRCQSGANTSYHVDCNGSEFYVSKCVAGSQSTLAGPVSQSFAAGDVLRLEVSGVGATVTLKVFKALAASPTSFTQVGTDYTDTASDRIVTAGYVGVFGYGNTPGTRVIGTWSAGNLGAAATADQEGARFGVDDSSESAHTWSQAQDANDTVSVGTARLIRALINGTGDLASAAYTLRYQKNGAGGYQVMPVGPSVAEAYGTVTFGAIGTGANGSTTVAPQPASPPAGAYMLAVITSGATNSETPTAPDGTWTLLATGASTDGTYGVDTGPRRVTVFGKVAEGTEGTTAITFSITNGGTCRGTISHFTKAGSGAWDVQAFGADDSTSGTGVSMTFSSMNWNTGDAVLVATGQRSDAATQSAQSLTATGVTFGTRTNRAATAVTTGNDHRHTVDTFAAISSTSDVDAAPTWAYTASAAASAGGVIVRLREYTAPVTNEIYVASSANITAGGEATTARLTAPSGKSTSDFVTGRRWDDENGTDTIDITTDDYTEVEWSINTQSPAANGDYFDFRVYAGSSALTSYTVTPRLTLGNTTYLKPRKRKSVLPTFKYTDNTYRRLGKPLFTVNNGNNVSTSIDTVIQEVRLSSTSIQMAILAAHNLTASINTAVVEQKSSTATIQSAIQESKAATANLNTAVQNTQVSTFSVNTALQVAFTATSLLDTAISQGYTSNTSINLAIQNALNALASIDSVIQESKALNTEINLMIQAATQAAFLIDLQIQIPSSLSANLDIAILEAKSSDIPIDIAIQLARDVIASIDTVVASSNSLSSNIDVPIQTSYSVNTSIDSAIRLSRLAASQIDSAIAELKTASFNLNLQIEAGFQLSSLIDIAISQVASALTTINTAIRVSNSANTLLDLVVQSHYNVSFQIDTLINASRAVTTLVNLYIDDGSIVTPSDNRTFSRNGQDRIAYAAYGRTYVKPSR